MKEDKKKVYLRSFGCQRMRLCAVCVLFLRDVLWDDLSSAFVKIYAALEVYLSNQTRRQLQKKGTQEDIKKYIT